MRAIPTTISDVLIVEPKIHIDQRGCFFESFNQRDFQRLIGVEVKFVQDNHSHSVKDVVRGLHYQLPKSQGKLVRVAQGRVMNVALDIRRTSATFLQHVRVDLSAENKRMVWIPAGFAHGFVVLSADADVLYKTTDYWYAEQQRSLLWCDPALSIDWCLQGRQPILSENDAAGKLLVDAELFD